MLFQGNFVALILIPVMAALLFLSHRRYREQATG